MPISKKKSNNKHVKHKDEVKYTFWRTKEDLKNIEKIRNHLKNSDRFSNWRNFNTDSEIYRKLPEIYMNAVKTINDQDLAIQELTAKQQESVELQDHICRIFEICNIENSVKKIKNKSKTVKRCFYFDTEDKSCDLADYDVTSCDGFDVNCVNYKPEED